MDHPLALKLSTGKAVNHIVIQKPYSRTVITDFRADAVYPDRAVGNGYAKKVTPNMVEHSSGLIEFNFAEVTRWQ